MENKNEQIIYLQTNYICDKNKKYVYIIACSVKSHYNVAIKNY